MVGLEKFCADDHSVAHPDPIIFELNRLQNQLKEKDRELGEAHSEIKALRAAEVLKEKAVEELEIELNKSEEKLRLHENHLEQKNLEIKRLTNDKKEALAAQYAAEATVRRLHADQKDNDSFPIESVIAPLEAEIRIYRHEVASLQEEKKALERVSKSKEAALLEAEKILRSALERALVVEEVQNQNFELKRQIEICQEENKILEKTNRQKVFEVEKLSQTVMELEEAILAGGAAANTIRDYRRQISELNDEKKTLERELARVKVSANRVATVVANEWKDENDKVMPVKQWLDERRLMQAELQRLKDKLAISERRANTEAQLKDKLKLRLSTLEEGLKHEFNGACGTKKPGKSSHFVEILSSNGEKKRSVSQPRASSISRNSQKPDLGNETNNIAIETKRGNGLKANYGFGDLLVRKSLWASRSKVVDGKENAEIVGANVDKVKENEAKVLGDVEIKGVDNVECRNDDMVSGFLYDKLQKEVISLRKSCEKKDSYLNAKDEEIKILLKKVETLLKALEVESKKMKRETAARDKSSSSEKVDDNKKITNSNSSKRAVK